MVVLSVLTKNESNKAAEDNYTVAENDYKAPDYGYNNLKYVKAKDNFNRSKMPPSGPNPVIKVPKYKKIDVDGMSMLMAPSTELPVVVISIGLKGGRMAEQNNLGKNGIAQLFAEMMDEDTKLHSAEEISVMLDKLGSSISFGADVDETGVTVRCLKKNLQETLDILDERLLQPKFTQDAFDRLKKQKIESIKNSKSRAAVVASTAYSKINFGKFNMLGLPGSGTEKSVESITLEDIKAFYKDNVSRKGMKVVAVGDLTDSEGLAILSRLNKLSDHPINFTVLPASNKAKPNTIYVVNVPRAAQTEFRVGYVTDLKYDALGEYRKCELANFPLGGAFNSRINLNLREEKGWTYGARSGFNGNDYTGTFTFSSGIKTSVTDSALAEVMREIKEYREGGISAEELSFMKNALGQSDARKYETGFQKAGFLINILQYKLPSDYIEKQNKQLQAITANEINTMTKKWIDPDKMTIVLAGDKDKITPGLEKLGYTVVEVDADGELK
jgi:zinc protease